MPGEQNDTDVRTMSDLRRRACYDGYDAINTNAAAMIALQNLADTQTHLGVVQNRITPGLKIASAKDNGAVWVIAQTEKA